jgi:hypothetical protein
VNGFGRSSYGRSRKYASATTPTQLEGATMRYSWFDLLLYVLAIVLLIPLVMRFIETLVKALD